MTCASPGWALHYNGATTAAYASVDSDMCACELGLYSTPPLPHPQQPCNIIHSPQQRHPAVCGRIVAGNLRSTHVEGDQQQ